MNINNYFSGKDDLQQIIYDQLDKAEKSICVAVAWLTDQRLFHKLLDKQMDGIKVELIITDHEINDRSKNIYEVIADQGGVFLRIGDDTSLMHNKFAVIDYDIVINGSFNWTLKANSSNSENISVVKGNAKMVKDFIEEFNRLKKSVDYTEEYKKEIEITTALKYFQLFKAYILIGETSKINPYLYEMKDTKSISRIVEFLENSEYDSAVAAMDLFAREFSQIINVSVVEKAHLLSQIKLLTYQIETTGIEKSELEAKIDQFNHRYILELNPYIAKILALKKKIYEKLKKYNVYDDTYEKAETEFNEANKQYEIEKKIDIPILNDANKLSIKQMYREAVGLCHPDKCAKEDEKKSAEIFDALTKAYKANDVEKVRYILNELKLGNRITNVDSYDDLDILRIKYETLQKKLEYLLHELEVLKASEWYDTLIRMKDWNEYFKQQKIAFDVEYDCLMKKYVK